MGSSTVTLQSIIEDIQIDGTLSPALKAGGFSTSNSISIANGVMTKLIAERFNWKWNRMKIPPFYTISWQQDYCSINGTGMGWLEKSYWIDINSTSLPKPSRPIEVVKDLPYSSFSASPPCQICWLTNKLMNQGVWPGNSKVYTNPLGAPQTPTNPPTNILDTAGNILVLTQYGTTAAAGTGPVAPNAWTPDSVTTVIDGTCVWTVANPEAQGFRLDKLPPQGGVVYQINVDAQMKMQLFTAVDDTLDPIPDDYSEYFRDGFRAYAHRNSPDPNVKKLFPMMNAEWDKALIGAAKQGDKERDSFSFVPERGVMAPILAGIPIGPANPYNGALYGNWWN